MDYLDLYDAEDPTPEQEAEEAFDEWYGEWLADMADEAYLDALPA